VKFILGFLIGLVTGPLMLIGSIALFIAGIMLGWKLFGDSSEEVSTATQEDSA
jgi:hypothetical protein